VVYVAVSRRRFLKWLAGAGVAVAAAGAVILLRIPGKSSNQQLPPGQHEVDSLIELEVGPVPQFDENTWTLQVYGLVTKELTLSYSEFLKIQTVVSTSDFNCVTGWDKLNNKWEGVQFSTIMAMAGVTDAAKYATFECENNYNTQMSLQDLSESDVLLAYRLDDKPLAPNHGAPLRLVIPEKYGYKNAKWVRKIKFTDTVELGYWESRGYSNTADVATNDR
jgi:DMSO/TMAO reductase YedYZ molybdopterin-dependent catalytic subunit